MLVKFVNLGIDLPTDTSNELIYSTIKVKPLLFEVQYV